VDEIKSRTLEKRSRSTGKRTLMGMWVGKTDEKIKRGYRSPLRVKRKREKER